MFRIFTNIDRKLTVLAFVLALVTGLMGPVFVQAGGTGGSGFSLDSEGLQDLFPSWETPSQGKVIQPVQPPPVQPPVQIVPQYNPPVPVYGTQTPPPAYQPPAPVYVAPIQPPVARQPVRPAPAPVYPAPIQPPVARQPLRQTPAPVYVPPTQPPVAKQPVRPASATAGKKPLESVDSSQGPMVQTGNPASNRPPIQDGEQEQVLPKSAAETGAQPTMHIDSELVITRGSGHTIYQLTDEVTQAIDRGAGVDDFFTLEKCIAIALEVNPNMMNAAWSVRGAEWEKKKAATGFYPSAQLKYSYSLLDETPTSQVQGRTITVGHRDNFSLRTTISQPIFNGFSVLSRYELARLGLDTAEIQKLQARLDLILETKQYYYLLLQAQKQLEVARQSEQQLEAHLKDARHNFEVGLVPKIQYLEAQVKLAQAVQTRTVAENDLEYARARLNTLLRRPLQAPVEVLDLTDPRPPGIPLNDCLAEALLNRPEILVAERQIEASGQNVRLAASGYYPDVSLAYNYEKQGDTWEVGEAEFKDSSSWNIAAEANWNIWDWGRTYKDVQTKKTELHKAYNTLDQVKERVILEVKRSYLTLESASKNISVSEKAVEQAEENFRLNNERYREQIATSTEVTDAQTLLTQAKMNYYNAIYQLALAKASLERAMGTEEIDS